MYKEEDSGSSHQQLFVQINKRGGTAPRAPLGPYVRNGSGGGGWGPVPLPINPGTASKTATMVIYGEQFGLTVMDEMQKGAILLLPSQA